MKAAYGLWGNGRSRAMQSVKRRFLSSSTLLLSHSPLHKLQSGEPLTVKDAQGLFMQGQRDEGIRALREIVRQNASGYNELELANMLGMHGQQLMSEQPPNLERAALRYLFVDERHFRPGLDSHWPGNCYCV
jgi:hypothetical protein